MSRIVTNAYWAHSLEAAQAKCAELREAGLDELNISMDDYHEPYIPFGRVKLAHQAAVEAGFRAVVIANACGPQSALSPELLEKEFGMGGVPVQRRFDVDGHSNQHERTVDGRVLILSNGNVQRLGRGLEMIADEESPTDSNDPMRDMTGGCPHAVRAAAISPRNHLLSCCGFELHGNPILDFGDMATHPVTELLAKADDDVIVNMIALIGPPQIMKTLKELCPDEVNFPRRRYQTYCEVCHDLVWSEKNRQALYRHQDVFANLILGARDVLAKKRNPETGRVPYDVTVRLEGISVLRLGDGAAQVDAPLPGLAPLGL